MSDSANREVRLQMRDAKVLFAVGDRLFYFLGGICFSEMLLTFTGVRVEISCLVLAFALIVVIGAAWVICRSLLRMRKAAV